MDRPVSAVRNTCFAILSAIECDLRELIADTSLKASAPDILPDDIRQVASQRFRQDNKDIPGVAPENDLDLLDYTDFADLAKMLRAEASAIEKEYKCSIATLALEVEKLTPARNRVCHSRPLAESDLPQFLDFAKLLLSSFQSMPWQGLKRIQETIARDPSYVLRLDIPSFWRVGTETIHHNLPLPDFDETSFLGRVTDRREVRKHLLGSHPVVTIVGEGGVGKSALAIQCLYEVLDITEHPPYDAIVWVSLKTKTLTPSGIRDVRNSITSTLGVVESASEALGVPHEAADDPGALVSELLDYMTQFKVLLVIDNFETLSSNSLRPLLTAVPAGSKVLITSRVGLGELEIRYKLDPLDLKTAVSLMRRFAKTLNTDLLAAASEGRLEKYANLLYKNPLLVKWFVQSVSSGADPERLSAKGNAAFESALRYCFENLFSRLSEGEREILHFLFAVRRALTFTELLFLLQQVSKTDELAVETALSTLYNSSMLKRMPADPRGPDGATSITLTDVAGEYLSRFAPPERKFLERVHLALKKLRELIERSAVQQQVYKYELYAIRADTRDQRICAAYLNNALKSARAGDFTEARKQVESGRALLPGYAEAYRIASIVETKSGDLLKAAEELEAAIQHDPTSALLHYQLGLFLLHEMEDLPQALLAVDKAIRSDPQDEALQTLRALVLTRLGRCKEASQVYERLLSEIDLRPRKWRITTRDQAAECYRRWAEQDSLMKDGDSFKIHLDRSCHILEEAFGAKDADSRMGTLYVDVIETGIFFALASHDAEYAIQLISRVRDASHVIQRITFRSVTVEHIERAFGLNSAPVAAAQGSKDRISWQLRASSGPCPPVTSESRTLGRVKSLPAGVEYGFVTDAVGRDWYIHRNLLKDPSLWRSLRRGDEVSFRPGRDSVRRDRAEDIDVVG